MSNILIADDDPVMVKLLEFNLKRSGYTVTVCREGLSVMPQAMEKRPVLAIFDLMLPGRSGLELIHDFKDSKELAELPIIVVTGQGKGSTKQELLGAGASTVFTKPFSPTILMSRIDELLQGVPE